VLAPLAVGGLLVAGYHTWVYGAPWRTGYGIGLALAAKTANPDKAGLFSYRFDSLSSHVRLYLLRPETLALLALAAIGVVAAVRGRSAGAKVVAAVLVAAVVVVLGYYGGRNTWGVGIFEANASFLRYLLPVLAFAALAVGVLGGEWVDKRLGSTTGRRLIIAVALAGGVAAIVRGVMQL
jgi:hypothetical protein